MHLFLSIIGSRGDFNMVENIYSFFKQKQFGLLILISVVLFFVHQQVGYSQGERPITMTPEKMVNAVFQSTLNSHQVTVENLTPTHQLFTFIMGQQPGYMVVSKDREEVQVIEYGLGSTLPYQTSIIFDQDIKKQQPDGFRYISPLESFWEFQYGSETVYMDGATGEWLPELKNSIQYIVQNRKQPSLSYYQFDTGLTDSYNHIADFDPASSLAWIVASPEESLPKDEIIRRIKAEETLIFKGTKLDELVSFAYPITGYMQWGEKLYLNVYDEALNLSRYILDEELLTYGVIVENKQ